MPQEVLVADPGGKSTVRTRRFGILEEGGFVETEYSAHGRRPATISGTVRDGDHRLLSDARVSVEGTLLATLTDAHGRFRLDGISPGHRRVIVEHRRYDALGVRAGEIRVLLDEGSSRTLEIVGPGADEVEAMLCDGEPERGLGTIRLTFVDSATTRPMRGLRISVVDRDGRTFAVDSETDERGVVVFCNAPANRPLLLTARSGKTSARVELKLPKDGLMARIVRWPGSGSIKL
jgi:hypothetical protein